MVHTNFVRVIGIIRRTLKLGKLFVLPLACLKAVAGWHLYGVGVIPKLKMLIIILGVIRMITGEVP